MRRFVFAIVILIGGFAVSNQAHAVVCANGVYRAGCAGPNGGWSPENTIITVITDRITGVSTALLVYTAQVVLVLMGRQSSADPTKAIAVC
jgi:hypothetical protein